MRITKPGGISFTDWGIHMSAAFFDVSLCAFIDSFSSRPACPTTSNPLGGRHPLTAIHCASQVNPSTTYGKKQTLKYLAGYAVEGEPGVSVVEDKTKPDMTGFPTGQFVTTAAANQGVENPAQNTVPRWVEYDNMVIMRLQLLSLTCPVVFVPPVSY